MSVSDLKIEAQYKVASKINNQLSGKGIRLTKPQQAQMFAFVKQAHVGNYEDHMDDVKPPWFPGQDKVDAWQSQHNLGREGALDGYVNIILDVLRGAGTEDAKKWIAEIENAK